MYVLYIYINMYVLYIYIYIYTLYIYIYRQRIPKSFNNKTYLISIQQFNNKT